jgi:putative flavoprotein involved in K+ transport
MRTESVHAKALVLGAGPAGLLAGLELLRQGFTPLLLERGQPGESWRRMPSNLRLVSPWRANHLAQFDTHRFPIHQAVTAAEYHQYLTQLAAASALALRTGVTVQRVQHHSGRFELETDRGRFLSSIVINATGYFSRPFIPDIPGAENSPIPQTHFAQCGSGSRPGKEPGGLAGRLVLVVGQRLSAAYLLPELVAAGCQVALAHRSPLAFGPNPFTAAMAFRLLPELERIRLATRGPNSSGFPPLMPCSPMKPWFRNGTVRAVGPLARFGGTEVFCESGESLRPDLILWATGFRPALNHLAPLGLTFDTASGRPRLNGFESAEQPGLFFLGLDGLRDFRSRFLRGLRLDAPLLAQQVATRHRTASTSVTLTRSPATAPRQGHGEALVP